MLDIYDRFEDAVAAGYYNDPRWKEVDELRKQNKHPEANGLVMEIRYDWGVEI